MKKNLLWGRCVPILTLTKCFKIMRLCILFLLVFNFGVMAAGLGQNAKVTLKMENAPLESIIKEINKQTGIRFFYSIDKLEQEAGKTIKVTNKELNTVLNQLLKDTKLTYVMRDGVVLIKDAKSVTSEQKGIKIKGTVVDKKGAPLPGVSIVVKGTNTGVSTDMDGKFTISVPSEKSILVFSFIGMETKEIVAGKQESIKVVLEEKVNQLTEVVANGYFKRSKETFTGASTTVSGDQLRAVSNTNLIQALVALTPGMHIVENNEMGSNPNSIPQIIIRGTTSLIDEENMGANSPLIILDGVEISMEELYDLDIEDIERIDILKDAAATSIYGDKASNGVIVIARKRVKNSELRVKYNFTPDYSIPDIRSLNLCNARQKLELERLSGLYDSESGKLEMAYRQKLANVNNGVDTDWASKPLRVSFSHNHSLSLSGRSNALSYRISTNFKDSYGVMKGDNRKNYGFSLYLGYFKSKKLTLNYRCSFSLLQSKNSPYGDFSQYVKLNPYNPVYDDFGDYVKEYEFDPFDPSNTKSQGNPLYNASLSSFDKSKSLSISNSIDARWEISKDLIATSKITYNYRFSSSDKYVSPDHSDYINMGSLNSRGRYTASSSNGSSYNIRVGLNYRILFNEGSAIRINAGGEIQENTTDSHSTIGKGFKKDWMSALKFAQISESSGIENINSSVGVYGALNMTYKHRYNLDLTCRTSGSSKYGKENKWGPFWSGGVSWNLHKEPIFEADWLEKFKLRVSSGYTGSSNFNPYQSMTVYKYEESYDQYTGIGAIPMGMGNPDLKWQRTLKTNYGLNAAFFRNRFSFSFDYFVDKTEDVIMSVSVPPSIGVKSVRVNYGEIENRGYDLSLSTQLINTKNTYWSLTVNGSHVIDKLNKISEDILRQNSDKNSNMQEDPNLLLIEGGSQYDIFGVRSAGIDPATGDEVFIDKDGNYTFKYNYLDKVAIGNTNPTLRGSMNSGFRYKNFSINVTASYTFGGDKYNTTLRNKIEKINPFENVDERAFTQRWKEPGDHTRFLGLRSYVRDEQQHTSRFVERYNEFQISNINFAYECKPKFLKKWGIKRLRIGYGMSDVARFSSMRYERGTSYPYCRRFNISIKPTF